jgi:hypothetical protein
MEQDTNDPHILIFNIKIFLAWGYRLISKISKKKMNDMTK